jgi:hypothetical protein
MAAEIPQSYDDQLVEKTITNLRHQPLRDPEAQAISENWIREAFGVSLEQSEEIGMLWMTKILGVTKEVADDFAMGVQRAHHKIGLLHAGSRTYTPDVKSFWEGVAKVAPKLASGDNLKYLLSNDHEGEGAWLMICHVDGINFDYQSLTSRLVSNALLYK